MAIYEGVWRKTQLLPCWILQVICATIYGVISILALVAAGYVNRVGRNSSYNTSYTGNYVAAIAIYAGVILAVSVFTILFNIIEAILYAKRKLNPVVILVFACLSTTAWGAYFVLAIISAAVGTVSIADIILGLILFATSIVKLVFSAKFTHLKRKGFFNQPHYNQKVGV